MSVRAGDIREILERAAPRGAAETPVSVLDDHAPDVGLVFRGRRLRAEGSVCDPKELWINGQAATATSASLVPVRMAFTADGEWVTGTLTAADLGKGQGLLLIDGAGSGAELSPRAWAVADGRGMQPATRIRSDRVT
ncbi:hypothetical protein [Streptomyces sp. CA2R101]|uniref:hypothetical protein n=1 Tax=Streptomyces sp. CA2R101 TaxID=3120152 RepID=UPI003008570B